MNSTPAESLKRYPIITKENSPELVNEYPILEGKEVEPTEDGAIRVIGLDFPIFLDAKEWEHIKNL